jgi:hypothetical protein
VFRKYISSLGCEATVHIGITYDERDRRKKPRKNERYPLCENQITDAMAAEICKEEGFDFFGFYTKRTRTGCWFCPLQNEKNLRSLWLYDRDKWERFCDMQERARKQFPIELMWSLSRKRTLREYQEKFEKEESGNETD